ncbi:hypothetical protein [Kineosporia babensis]|uniref:Pilus assembly protein n=1 Tax=Kineosporia babensis TaxID=499548 RepID=A0A9X1SXN4_9ACTN|nr:hypothetical protein [Kineosporia babensis]MCD5316121.1 hypothetical protein [Kineosporia babensis]
MMLLARRLRRLQDEVGSLSVEMVILGAVVVVVLCLGMGAGTLVVADGRVSAAASAAARAASLESNPGNAGAAARAAAQRTLEDAGTACVPVVDLNLSQFGPGGHVDVEVTCRIDLTLFSIAGFAPRRDLTASAGAPLEQRRTFGGRS